MEQGLLASVLVSMNDTSEQDVTNFLGNFNQQNDQPTEQSKSDEENRSSQISIPLTEHRIGYLEHLLDDIYCFLNYESRQRNYEVLC